MIHAHSFGSTLGVSTSLRAAFDDTAARTFPGPSPASSAPGEVGDRSTTFQAVEGGTEHRSGETLLVAAYAGLWALLMLWVVFQWRKQTALGRRIDELEVAVAQAGKLESSRPSSVRVPPELKSDPAMNGE